MAGQDAAPRPPRKSTGTKKAAAAAAPAAPRRPGRPSSADKLRESLTQTYVGLGVAAAPVCKLLGMSDAEQLAVSMAVVQNAPAAADAWVQLAETNPRVRKALEGMTEASGWGTVLFAHVSIGLAVSAGLSAARQAEMVADEPAADAT